MPRGYTPAPPSPPRVVDTTRTSISLAWTKPTYDGTDQWYRVHTTATIRNAEFTVTGLRPSQKYRFRVAATNINGISEYSESPAEIEPVERLGNVTCIKH
uniref:Fibronectin type-III domain-containing protein n=1 Tax=Laticauda laticaudata TaxID=8630 RepID=A0A8C5SMC6_LATLA